MSRKANRLAVLGCIALAAGCRSLPQNSVSRSPEAALFAAAERILSGRLEVVSLHKGIANIKIGESSVYVGGDGRETPPDIHDTLRRLSGSDVVAGVRGYDFHFGRVLVVVCQSWNVALGSKAQFLDVVVACEALRSREDWRDSACRLESGHWDRLLSSVRGPHSETTDELLSKFLRSASGGEIARDIAGWHARMLGMQVEAWPGGQVRIGDDTIPVEDVRDVAERVLEGVLELPMNLLSSHEWDGREKSRRIWILTELRTRD